MRSLLHNDKDVKLESYETYQISKMKFLPTYLVCSKLHARITVIKFDIWNTSYAVRYTCSTNERCLTNARYCFHFNVNFKSLEYFILKFIILHLQRIVCRCQMFTARKVLIKSKS
ncbi:hypothetical protein CHUAL_012398 [Chamberlinius hualienensis]